MFWYTRFFTLGVITIVYCSELFENVYLGTRYYHEEESDFVSVEITDFQSCKHLCHVQITCEAVNFSHRGNICRLVHQLTWSYDDFTLHWAPGVITWLKVSQSDADDDTVCQPQDQRDYCKTYCGETYGLLNGDPFDGNFLEAGSKMTCKRCFSVSNPLIRAHVTATCSDQGNWVFRDDRCEVDDIVCQQTVGDYGKYSMIFNRRLEHKQASEACTSLDTSLVQITTYTRLQFYVDVIKSLDDKVNNYWMDAHDVGGTWQTSDGQNISTDVINHHNVREPCARIVTTTYEVHNRECELEFGFIYEADRGYWFDAHDVNGTWLTSDGQEISTDVVNQHADAEPCARIHTATYRVRNCRCEAKFGFICEF